MKENKKQQAVIYCRVSSAKQVREGHGLGSQETRCREFAARMDYDVVDTFRDEGVSGGLIDRTGMQAMLAFLRKHRRHRQHVVIIDDISRLARGIEAHIQLRTAIQGAGGKLESPSIEFGDDSDSILVENLLASVSQHQRQKNAEQVVNRMRARVTNGYWVFAPPVGYRYEKVSGHGSMLVPDEPNATLVREVFEGFASGRFETQTEILRFLKANPPVRRNPKGEIVFNYVRLMLERPIYAGYIDLPDWNIRLLPAKHEPLISLETWKKVQDRLKGTNRAPIRKDINADFPLRGFVTCGCCGEPMTAAWSKGRAAKYPYYYCYQPGCPERRKTIRKEHLEEEFEALLESVRPASDMFAAACDMLRELWDDRMGRAQERAANAKADIAKIARQTDQLMDRIVEADSPTLIAAYESRIRKLEEEKALLSERVRTSSRPLRTFDQTFRTACAFLANPCQLWNSDRLEDKRMVLRLVFGGRLPYRRNKGFRTGILTLPFKVLAGFGTPDSRMVEGDGFEPPYAYAGRFTVCCL